MSILKGVMIIAAIAGLALLISVVAPQRSRESSTAVETVSVVHHAHSRSETFLYVDGEMRNDGGNPARYVKAVGTFYDAGGAFIGAESTYVLEIQPGQMVVFRLMFRDPDERAVTYRVRAET